MRGTDGANTVVPDVAGTAATLIGNLETHGDGAWATATGFSTHSAADVVTALGTGSTLTACLTATGFSTHSAADVVTALGTGSTLTACLTATGFSTHSATDVVTALGTGSTLTACATATGFATPTDISNLQTHGDATWATATGFSTLDADDILTALGLAEGNLDEQFAAITGGATAEEVRIEMDANSTRLAAIAEDTNELQTDWADGGRLDLLLDAAGGGATGSGAVEWTVACQVGGVPIEGMEVWITTDAAGANIVAGTLCTDANGLVTFMLDAGDYYVWRQKAGYNLTNPQAMTVTE